MYFFLTKKIQTQKKITFKRMRGLPPPPPSLAENSAKNASLRVPLEKERDEKR